MEPAPIQLWTKYQLAQFWNVSAKTVDEWMANGKIEFTRTPGGAPRFTPPTENHQ